MPAGSTGVDRAGEARRHARLTGGLARGRGRPATAETSLAAVTAAALAGLFVAALPPGGDTAAHLYRTWLLENGAFVWDTFWYSGHSPFLPYSALYYPLAALAGHEPLVLAATAVSAALFASVATVAWGEAGRWPARAFAIVAPAPLLLGEYPYALGVTALLGAVRSVQAGRLVLAAAAAVLTFGFSPLAFLFLSLVLGAAWLAHPVRTARAAFLALTLALLAALGLGVFALFSPGLTHFFPTPQLLAVLAVSISAGAVGLRAGRDPLMAFFAVWACASVVAYLVPAAVGVNITRIRWLVFPLVLAAVLRARFRPRWLAVTALGLAFGYNAVPYAQFIRGAPHSRSHEPAFWAPALDFLAARMEPRFRVEVVPTAAHWEAYFVPRAGFALARGWYRQLDLADNELLYEETIEPAAYRAWLRRSGVRYVLLPRARLNQHGAGAEARLLLSGRSGLGEAFRHRDWTIYELPAATPILTGPAPARVTGLRPAAVAGWIGGPGEFRLRVRYTSLWRVSEGRVCAVRAHDGSTLLRARSRGRFRLVVDENPVAVVTAAATGAGAC